MALFLLLTSYYLVKPLRSSFFLKEFDPAMLPYFFLCFPFLSLAVTRLFDFFYARLPRLRLIFYTYGVVMGCKLFFWLTLPLAGKGIILAFYLWSSVYFLLCISVLWACVSSVFTAASGERWFAMIALGGMAGAYGGSAFSSYLSQTSWSDQTLAVSMVLMAGVLLFLALALRTFSEGQEQARTEKRARPSSQNSIFEDLKAIWQRPFIRGLGVIVFAVAFMNTVVEFKTQKVIDRQLAEAQYLESFADLNTALCQHSGCQSLHQPFFEKVYTLKQEDAASRETVLTTWLASQSVPVALKQEAAVRYTAYQKALEQKTRGFFSDINQWINLIGAFLLVVVARPLFRWVGLRWVVLLLPCLFLVAAFALLFPLELSLVSGLLVGTGTLNYSLNKTAKELLYTAADEEVRFRFKPLIDGPLVRFGDVAAALLTLLVTQGLHLSLLWQDHVVLGVGITLCFFWGLTAYRSGRIYDQLKASV